MKKISDYYGIPFTMFLVIIGVILITINPKANNGGGFDLPAGLYWIFTILGVAFLLAAVVVGVNTFRRKNR